MDFQGISDCDERTQRNIVVSAFDGLNRGLPNPKLFRECLVGVAAVPADFGQVSENTSSCLSKFIDLPPVDSIRLLF